MYAISLWNDFNRVMYFLIDRSAPLFADEDHQKNENGNEEYTHDDIDSFGLLITFFHQIRNLIFVLD